MAVMNANDKVLWDSYIHAWKEFLWHKTQLIRQTSNLKQVVEYGLSEEEITAALGLMQALPIEERKSFFSVFLQGASYQNPHFVGYIDLVLSFPPKWLLENIEEYSKPILAGEDKYEEYACLMSLFYKIDRHLAIRLCQQAIVSNDEEVKELGRSSLQSFTSS